MTIRKRGSKYAVEVYDPSMPNKKRYAGSFERERDAKDAERHEQADVSRQARRRAGSRTVAEWADRWPILYARAKASTNLNYAEQIRAFVRAHGQRRLADVDRELALEWLAEKKWTHGGLRAMFGDAVRAGLIADNPFAGLGLTKSPGRRDLKVLTVPEVERLAEHAAEVWPAPTGATIRALVLAAAFVGMRPAELYGLRWSDIDFRADEIHVERQYHAATHTYTTLKNGHDRRIVLTPRAKAALMDLPRAIDAESHVFLGVRGGPLSGRVQHYYWHPVRCRFGNPSMDFYELRHFCGSWMFNDLELPAQDVAHQLGHRDGRARSAAIWAPLGGACTHADQARCRRQRRAAPDRLGGGTEASTAMTPLRQGDCRCSVTHLRHTESPAKQGLSAGSGRVRRATTRHVASAA